MRNLVASPVVALELGGEVADVDRAGARAGEPTRTRSRGGSSSAKYQPGYGEDLRGWGRSALPVAIAWDAAAPQS